MTSEDKQKICEQLVEMRKKTSRITDVNVRVEVLKKLRMTIRDHMSDIEDALWKDLHKSVHESYLTEVSVVIAELNACIRHLKKWAKMERVPTPYFLLPSKSRIVKEPHGLVLIMAPWNYPFQLNMVPLISAIAAGNSVVLAPSPNAMHTANAIAKILESVFTEDQVAIFGGDIETNQLLLHEQFDYIFFTGSPRVGQIVMEAASLNLTPVTLELGGKSPCIVGAEANIEVAARRIAWGKFINAGQTCVAPDYVFVHRSVKEALLENLKKHISTSYGENPQASPDYPRVINQQSFDRLCKLMDGQTIYYGGQHDSSDLYIAPTIVVDVDKNNPIMQDEIFGPLLPILTFDDDAEVLDYINDNPKPLALYYFGSKQKADLYISQTSSGGACVNDVVLHLANNHLPFGGVGQSGMGSYHGRVGFNTFSHRRSVLISRNWFDIFLKYPPYKHTKLLKKIM